MGFSTTEFRQVLLRNAELLFFAALCGIALVPRRYAEIPLSFAEFLFFAVQIEDSVICNPDVSGRKFD